MATIVERSRLTGELEDQGFIQAREVLDPKTIDSLLMRAHATLFRETAEDRDAVRSNGSLIHLADNPEYADIIGSPALTELLRECGATDPRFTGGFLISSPAAARLCSGTRTGGAGTTHRRTSRARSNCSR
jgi:hypothetical protein